ncbi:Hsp20/alpha crystallin family protein [Methylocaldum szegediense]|uniref:HSP20 family molecular chaperone IbpA n=1 Tax=Methylocaldum szegediense TaxID=73780 RepID=A0ABM9I1W0_9GAMM|nr:Hsp20/alpha crystallin family protein [Methylocaldum szegediense]CAI8836278.1 HSP20 family molecular chaperone IbpA [Methylocaldum szegediense]
MLHGPTTWMWAQACELLEQAERLHRRFFQVHRLIASRPAWEPPVDIIETSDAIIITVVLPGVSPDAITVAVAEDSLVVSGERTLNITPDTAVIHRLEIPYGRFERRIQLPPWRLNPGEPNYANGCLTIPLFKTD